MRGVGLADIYRAVRPEVADGDLEERLAALCRAGAQEWPRVDASQLVAALAALPSEAAALDEEAAREVALALGCAAGDGEALARFEQLYLEPLPRVLGAMKLDRALLDDVAQETRRKLLVSEDGASPRIVGYAGRGSLAGLVKVTATRTAITLLRKTGRESPGDDAILDATGERDPELGFLKAHYRAAFREAFEDAIGSLGARERNLLRLHFLRKVTLDALATMYGVHRATIVRQLASVRDELERATKKGLRARLGVSAAELDSVMDLIKSRFDASVERLLRTMEE